MSILSSSTSADIAFTQVSQSNAQKSAATLKDARNFERIEEVAQEFEAVFISEMMKPMFEGIKVNETFGGGKGEEVFRGMMLQEYGKIMAQTGAIGIADQVRSTLIQMQAEIDGQNQIQSQALSQTQKQAQAETQTQTPNF